MEIIPVTFSNDWTDFLEKEKTMDYFRSLELFLEQERRSGKEIFPPKELVFNAFGHTTYASLKVVILGQDPYHGYGQARGLSFSVAKGMPLPPSLKNIFKELRDDLGLAPSSHGCLLSWACQGVLLLNATLTVRRGEPNSHVGKGWDIFTDHVLERICKKKDPVIFLLWGRFAQEKCLKFLSLPEYRHHIALQTTHPSPFSAHGGFLGSHHFSTVNRYLKAMGKEPVDWSLS